MSLEATNYYDRGYYCSTIEATYYYCYYCYYAEASESVLL